MKTVCMTRIIFILILTLGWTNHLDAQIYTGSSAIGIKVDTINLIQSPAANSSLTQNLYFNCDSTTVSAQLMTSYIYFVSSAGSHWEGNAQLILSDTNIQVGTSILTYSDLFTGSITYMNGAIRLNSGIFINDTSSFTWNTNDSIWLNKNLTSPWNHYYFNYYNNYIPLRKKYGNEYLYGWIFSTGNEAGANLNGSYPVGDIIYQVTKFPKLKLIHDTILCNSSYTFLDGFTLNNILHDTMYDFSIQSTTIDCDSLVRTKLKVLPSYFTTTYDTICIGMSYTFPDSLTISNIIHDTIHNNAFSSVNGCDSLIVSSIHVLGHNLYDTVLVCYGSSYTYPDGYTESNIISNLNHICHFNSVNGCDSNTHTHVIFIPPSSTFITTACDSYFFNDQTLTSSGVYYDTLLNVKGCDSMVILNLTINTINTSILQVLNSLTSNQVNATYQWLTCNPYSILQGETNQTFNAISNGDYAVAISKNGCVDTSDCSTVISVGLNTTIAKKLFDVYPNPASEKLTISSSLMHAKIELYNTLGQLVYSSYFKTLLEKLQIDISNLPKGIYYLKCEGLIKKVIIE